MMGWAMYLKFPKFPHCQHHSNHHSPLLAHLQHNTTMPYHPPQLSLRSVSLYPPSTLFYENSRPCSLPHHTSGRRKEKLRLIAHPWPLLTGSIWHHAMHAHPHHTSNLRREKKKLSLLPTYECSWLPLSSDIQCNPLCHTHPMILTFFFANLLGKPCWWKYATKQFL